MIYKKLLAAALSLCVAFPSAVMTSNAADKLIGDANDDGKVTIADLVVLQNYLLGNGSLKNYENSDIYADGVVDTFDLIAMRQRILEIPMYVPYVAKNLSRDVESETVEGMEADEEFILGQTEFALNLFQKEIKEDQNVMISPYSVMQALAMTSNGADGNTKTEMENVLGGIPVDTLNKYLYTQRTTQSNTENCSLKTANSIWARDGEIEVYPEFLQKNANYYGAEVFNAPFDFTTITDINNWVNANTDKMIPELLKEIDNNTVMYLINAVAFDAEWENKYSENEIGTYNFTAYDGTEQSCEMMYSEEHQYIEDDNAFGFVKKYKGGKYAFAAVLPNEGIDLNDYISGLTADSLNKLLSDIQYDTVITRMPKFSYEYDTLLNQPLIDMGMPTAFTPNADFTKMGKTLTDILRIGKVIHKTFISVDEAGTKAGAVTAVSMTNDSCVLVKREIILDRPFAYFIIDTETNLPIFMGTVMELS